MLQILLIIVLLLLLINLYFTYKFSGKGNTDFEGFYSGLEKYINRIENQIKDESGRSREDTGKNSIQTRRELSEMFKDLGEHIAVRINESSNNYKSQFDIIAENIYKITSTNAEKLSEIYNLTNDGLIKSQDIFSNNARSIREELSKALLSFENSYKASTTDFNELQKQKFSELTNGQKELVTVTENKIDAIRGLMENKLKELQSENSIKLDEMRLTVDEKLQTTLERRFNDSFMMITERLEQVHNGLGEMKNLAVGVGDLKKVLTNVKNKGILGEYQLENILTQILTPDQYAKNVKTQKGSNSVVEFAIKMPGKDDTVWLPLDSKFPLEVYQSLVEAYETADSKLIADGIKNLASRIKSCAKDISEKYIDPPNTTDFAIMFLPIEGLYAEVLRNVGLFETLQRDYKVIVTGPTTISALLNSLQMGFRTLAIEKRSSEVWNVLGAIKTEFSKFGDVLDKTQKKLNEASTFIDTVGVRKRAIDKKLKSIQELSNDKAELLLYNSTTLIELDGLEDETELVGK